MRLLIVALALFAVSAIAVPQYGYEPAGSTSGLTARSSNGVLGGSGGVASGIGGGAIGNGNSISHGSGRGGDKYLPPESEQQAPLINKQFYTISAPEDNVTKSKHLVLGKPQKNFRVIFIKAPTPDNVKYSAEFAPQEEKTVIYVLHKKGEDIDAANIGTPAPTVPSKPEVFFIKYKTPEEAQQAQKEIQDQYDQLGGNNQFGEDTAPITSVVGALDSLNPDGSYNYRQVNGGSANLAEPQQPQQPSSQYLPSFLKV
ncbi:PREDICTED: uncharacterized protein LOC108976136 [Bactrocera latifrons]|uniref:uncharacterized protein LOC108976136 n=1 Tax=Bactrocera latifrons TaxID=174628 RepID=UPI0008DE49A4|nr:PREDICTED: uncharacterized protein LOC108976136 [Bactrocera latifrons]